MWSHSGAFLLGTATTVYLVPGEKLGIVVLTNAQPVGLAESVALNFLDFVHHGTPKVDYLAVLTKVFHEFTDEFQNASPDYSVLVPPPQAKALKQLSAYTGKYFNQFYGTLEIAADHGQLVLRLPPRGAYYELTHWDGDTFTFYMASENTGIGRRGVKFTDANHVLVENLAVIDSGIFTRIAGK